jgi:hypothetical protein
MNNSEKFTEMAARIEHNQPAEFAGAAVIVPPAGGGEPIEILILDKSADSAVQFWATIMARGKQVLEAVDQERDRARQLGMMVR